jgi:isopentenyl-diphosphate delta-isomerase type 1
MGLLLKYYKVSIVDAQFSMKGSSGNDMNDSGEHLEVVNEKGEVMGVAPRSEIHGNPSLMHRVVHVLVFNPEGKLLLQKRSLTKDVAPGKWDTSVGGHVGIGEELSSSARREMEEELGISDCDVEYLYSYIHRGRYETELVSTYRCINRGDISFNKNEIDDVRFWSLEEVKGVMGKGILSAHFEDEFRTYLGHTPRMLGP